MASPSPAPPQSGRNNYRGFPHRSTHTDLLDRTTSQTGERGLTTSYSDFTDSGTPRKVTFSDGTYGTTTLDAASRPVKVETRNAAEAIIATNFTTYHPDGQVEEEKGEDLFLWPKRCTCPEPLSCGQIVAHVDDKLSRSRHDLSWQCFINQERRPHQVTDAGRSF